MLCMDYVFVSVDLYSSVETNDAVSSGLLIIDEVTNTVFFIPHMD